MDLTVHRVGVSSPRVSPRLRNPGFRNLDLDAVHSLRVNTPYVRATLAEMFTRRAVKGFSQTAFLMMAIEAMDLTTLQADDTRTNVERLAAAALQPVRPDILAKLGFADHPLQAGAVCVYERQIEYAKRLLEGSGVPVAAVSTGFPAGQELLTHRIAQIRTSVELGADEIDVVINREALLSGRYQLLWDELRAMREVCGDARMKVILGAGDLGTLEMVARANEIAVQAGADFTKTSTGFDRTNATLSEGLVMLRGNRDYEYRTRRDGHPGYMVGLKPAGGVSTAGDALKWLTLMREESGTKEEPTAWMRRDLFRIGAGVKPDGTGLLADIRRQLERQATGHYGAQRNHPPA